MSTTSTPIVSVVLIDDNPIFLNVAARFLRSCKGLVLAGTASAGQEGLARVAELTPDVVLVDLNLPDISGLELLPRLRQLTPRAGLVVLTLHDSAQMRAAAFSAGADEFVSKSNLTADLEPAIRRVAEAHRSRALSKSIDS